MADDFGLSDVSPCFIRCGKIDYFGISAISNELLAKLASSRERRDLSVRQGSGVKKTAGVSSGIR